MKTSNKVVIAFLGLSVLFVVATVVIMAFIR